MKSASEFWKERFGEEPKSDKDKLMCAMMREYADTLLQVPVKSTVEDVITRRYKEVYGTNYSEGSLSSAKEGGLIITEWIFNHR